jgi:tetratricopeptide (TPR) repeat protein/TolB-like protein/predicted Ser/Thr protein kinase
MSEPAVRTLGRYQLLEEIGRGGMGVVYRALDTTLHREVAIKILPPELVADPERKRRFLVEAQTASQLEHPHIGVIHEVGDADGMSFIAMELIRGEKLSDVLTRGDLSAARAIELATEVAEGLALAHDKGVVHRDLKPANVMVTEHGHAKIIDFGLAKLVRALSGDGATETVAATNPGVVMGTAAYMSPEQARAGKVDARSDIFSFGVMLYEMLAHRLPFRRQSDVDTLHALLHDPTPPLPPLGPAVTDDASADLQRILEKCLAKEPDARYQGARDIVVDLRAARRRLESGTTISTTVAPAARPAARPGPGWLVWTGIGAAAAAILAVWLVPRLWTRAPIAAPTGKPRVAVLYFQNNTGSTQLDWLRTGLTEMMVTDLSQSPDVEILGTDRLHDILRDLHRQDDAVVSFDTVQEIAKRAGVQHVLIGGYVKAGDTIRITTTLQEAATGRIISSDRVDAAGEAGLFGVVDDLTRRIKSAFAVSAASAADRGLLSQPGAKDVAGSSPSIKDVTTSSPDAYRAYLQGLAFHQRNQEPQAISFFEKAIGLDPTFALAMTKLAVAHSNSGHWDLRIQYAKQALDLADRLGPRERYYIEAYYYSSFDEHLDKAIAAYKKVIELYPDHESALNNLGVLYAEVGRLVEAIQLARQAVALDPRFVISNSNLANYLARAGQLDESRAVLEAFLRADPTSASAYRMLTDTLIIEGRPDDALAALANADALDGGAFVSPATRWIIATLRGRAADAAAQSATLMRADGFAKFIGTANHSIDELYQGRLSSALAVIDRLVAGQAARGGSDQTALLRSRAAKWLIDTGQPALALAQAEHAVSETRSGIPGRDPELFVILAKSRLGRDADVTQSLSAMATRAATLPGPRDMGLVHWVTGVIALDHRENGKALEELREAERTLSPYGILPPPPPHARVWFDFGRAYLAAGDDQNAATRFERVVTRSEGVLYPIEVVRSLYFLGEIAERRGDRDKARQYYQKFVDHWGSGEIDRDHVTEAKRKLAIK